MSRTRFILLLILLALILVIASVLFGVLTYGLDEAIPSTDMSDQRSMGWHTPGGSGGQILTTWSLGARKPAGIRTFGTAGVHTERIVGRGG